MKRPSGSALILAIWTLFFLAALAVAVHGHVSANLRLAQHISAQGRAQSLARAGVALAISDVLEHPDLYRELMPTNLAERSRRESLFLNNKSLPDGVFTVGYLVPVVAGGGKVAFVTNFGLVRETAKLLDLDAVAPGGMAWTTLVAVVGADAATGVTNYPDQRQKTVATDGRNAYGDYEALQELLAVDGVSYDGFELLERIATLQRYKFSYPKGRKTLRQTLGGMSEGLVTARGESGAAPSARRRITFVYDTGETNFLYWREH